VRNVLYITHDGLLDPLGQSQILPYLYGLSDNFNISVLSFEKKDKLNTEEHVKLKKKLNEKNINHKYLRFLSKLFLPWLIFTGFVKGIKIVKKNEVNFSHARGFTPCIISWLLKKTLNIPFIFDMRGFWVEERVDAGIIKKGKVFKILKKIEKTLLSNADHITVLTKAAKQELISRYNVSTPISVIPTCVDTTKFTYKKHNYKKIKLLYLGSCGTFYNFNLVLFFFKLLNEKTDSNLTLTLNNPECITKENIKEINSNKNIFLFKKLKRTEVPKLIKTSNFSIFFYKTPNSGKGFFPTRMGESLACGLPVITNGGVGDCSEIIEENRIGVILDEPNEKTISKAIKRILELVKDDQLNKRCRTFAENYLSLKKGVEKYENIYETI